MYYDTPVYINKFEAGVNETFGKSGSFALIGMSFLKNFYKIILNYPQKEVIFRKKIESKIYNFFLKNITISDSV